MKYSNLLILGLSLVQFACAFRSPESAQVIPAPIQSDAEPVANPSPDPLIDKIALEKPSQLTATQQTLADYESQSGTLSSNLKNLKSLAIDLSLLQIVTVQNGSSWPIQIGVPVQLSGTLTSHMIEVDLSQQFCSYSLAQKEWDESFADALYAIPLTADLSGNFTALMNGALSEGAWNIPLDPGASQLVGLYASGTQAGALTKSGHQASTFTAVAAVNGCTSRCGSWNQDNTNWGLFKGQAEAHWQSLGWPGASKVCDGIQHAYTGPGMPTLDENALNQCAEWELSNGTAPWDKTRFCASMWPGNEWNYPAKEFWSVTKSTTSVQVGIQSAPVMLSLQPDTTVIHAMYNFPNVSVNSPVADFPGLIQLQTKQAD